MMAAQVVLDDWGDETHVSAGGKGDAGIVTVRSGNDSDQTVMFYTPDQARELADALMRAAASLRWEDGVE